METIDCFNAALNKPKLLIIGHGRHGKDTFADLVVAKMDLSFVSSSEFVGRQAIWEQWGKERYAAFSDFFEDRVNHRGLWFNFIVAYNTPNLARTGEEMMAEHDVYVGMRNPDEFHACMDKGLFDHVIWVDGSKRHPLEPKESMGLTREMANIWIDNNGPEINLQVAVNNLQKRLHAEGFEVNYSEEPIEKVEPGLYSKEMEKIWHQDDADLATDTEHFQLVVGGHPDPCDPPTQKPLEINSDRPTLKEYMGIINPPMVPDQGALPPNWNDMSDGEVKCNGDCGCEDGSLCHEDVCGPISKMAVNLTLEEDRKIHNDALMATCPDFTYKGGAAPAKPSTFNIIPEIRKWIDEPIPLIAKPKSSVKPPLDWKDAPEGATKVLDHGFFKVLGVMGTDQDIVDAARMSYGRGTKPVNSSEGLINYLVRNHHTSPLEMCEIKFHIRMPIFVMRQWVRHRTANLNEYSGRYSEMVRLFYVPQPEQICYQSIVNKQASDEPLDEPNAMMALKIINTSSGEAFDRYELLLRLGVSRETARILLPLNTYTEVVWKLDISNLIKFLMLRDDDHAQWEIRQYAKLVSKAVEEYFPLVFAAYQEARATQSFSAEEIGALISGDTTNLSSSQTKKITDLRDGHF